MIGPSSVRMKLLAVLTALLAAISLAVFVIFPARLRDEALAAVGAKAESFAEMTAYNVAHALVFDDHTAAQESFAGVQRDRDLAYLVVYDARGQRFAGYPARAVLSTEARAKRESRISEDGALYETSRPILHNGRVIGRVYLALALDAVNAEIAHSRATVGLIALLLFLFGVLAATMISAVITRPLTGIVEVVREIAAGRLDRRAEAGSRDEIGHLARSLNAMVDQLESLQRDLETRVRDRTRELQGEIEERRHAEDALRGWERRYRLLFERNLAGVYRTTVDGTILDCNDACARIFGYEDRSQLVGGEATRHFFDPDVRKQVVERLRKERSIPNVELELRRRDGAPVWVLESMSMLEGDGGQEIIEATIMDITARKEAERRIRHQAYHDALTGLPNRALFTDRVSVAIPRARRKQNMLAVLFLDLDRFKYVNDTFGHSAGDDLLQQVARRLQGVVREEDTVARLGGDEFTILLSDLGAASDAAKVAQKLIEAMSSPFVVHGHELYITPSIGIALYPTDGTDVDTLLRNADNAMYRAKETGPNNYHLYSEAVNKRATMRLSLETSLRHAVDRNELVVHYQPQVCIDTGALSGIEALVRWHHPTRGLLAPDHFIGLAEETKLIVRIDEWVLREACRQARAWEQQGLTVPRLAVNVSATQLRKRNLARIVQQVLEETSLTPSRLELEITESAAVHTDHETLAMLRAVRESGVRIAIDDFGMGNSALHYLHRFPVDTIKIDRSFVAAVEADRRSGAIISAIVTMARAMDLDVIAEGIESAEQLATIRQLGCEQVQGFFFSRPVTAPQIMEFVQHGLAPEPPHRRPTA